MKILYFCSYHLAQKGKTLPGLWTCVNISTRHCDTLTLPFAWSARCVTSWCKHPSQPTPGRLPWPRSRSPGQGSPGAWMSRRNTERHTGWVALLHLCCPPVDDGHINWPDHSECLPSRMMSYISWPDSCDCKPLREDSTIFNQIEVDIHKELHTWDGLTKYTMANHWLKYCILPQVWKIHLQKPRRSP